MNGKLMKMELDGNINNKENIGEISEKRLEEIKQEYPNFMQICTINDKISVALGYKINMFE